jgi:DNA-binding transcriptional MerR regulator/effector-binding domain-containing protein
MLNIGGFARLGHVSPRMLRHYDETGLLTPSRVDPHTGYRFYDLAQLGRLHRLLALRDLGFTLEQIRPLLDDELGIDELRGMLRMRRAQIEQTVAEDLARVRRVEAHLHALSGDATVQLQDVVVKRTDPVRVAEAVGHAPGFGTENVSPVFVPLLEQVLADLAGAGARPGIAIAHYEEPADDGSVVLHVGCDIGAQAIGASATVQVVELPVVEVASVIHQGTMDGIAAAFDALVRWTEDSGYQPAGPSRELYHEWHAEDPTRHVTELQLVLTPSAAPAPGRAGG